MPAPAKVSLQLVRYYITDIMQDCKHNDDETTPLQAKKSGGILNERGHLNIKLPSYQYRNSHYILYMERPFL